MTPSLLVLLVHLVGPVASPPPEQPLTLREAVARAIEGNVELRREGITVEIAAANLAAARGQFDVVASAAVQLQRTAQPLLSREDVVNGVTTRLGLTVALGRNLESGGALRLAFGSEGIDTSSAFTCGSVARAGGGCRYYQGNLTLTFSHPLLRGLGFEVTQANLRRQRVQHDVALLNQQVRVANVLRDVVSVYWEVSFAAADLDIRRSAVELAREQLRLTQAQIDVGRLAILDLAAVERAISDRLGEVASAEDNLVTRTLALQRLLGVPPAPDQPVLRTTDVPAAGSTEVATAEALARALESNPQLASLRTGIELTAIDLQTVRDTLRPRLDLVATVGAQGRSLTLAETVSQTTGLDQLSGSAGLTFELPIPNRTARGLTRAAEQALGGARLDAAALELDIREAVLHYASQLRSAGTRAAMARQAVGFATRNLAAEKARFAVGRSTNNDVLLRQQELKAAEIAAVRATVDALESDANLSALTGEILDHYGVVLRRS